jgi:hypothetical protein
VNKSASDGFHSTFRDWAIINARSSRRRWRTTIWWHDKATTGNPLANVDQLQCAMPSGVTTLRGIAVQFPGWVTVACNRCDRRGKLRTARLVAQYGADLSIPELGRILAADCPKMIAGEMHDACGIHFPGLAG